MWSKSFWASVAERAGKTFAQALIPILAADGADLLHLDWPTTLGLAGTAALLSVATSVGSLKIGPAGSPSLVDDTPPRHALREG